MNEAAFKIKPATKLLVKILKCFVIAAILFVSGVSAFLYFNVYLTQGNGPAGPKVPAKPFQQVWSQQDILLLGIGDSITNGFGAPKGFSYFDRLMENPPGDSKDMTGKNLSVIFPRISSNNLAVSGSVSSEHFRRIQNLARQPSDVMGIVVMTTGGNDLIHDYGRTDPKEYAMYGATLEQAKPWIKNFDRRLEQMIPGMKEKFPGGCHIFLANIYDPTDGTGNTSTWVTGLPAWRDAIAILSAYNEIISRCADKYDYVHLVNIHNAFLGHGIHCKKFWLRHYRFKDPHYWYYMNIEDPNPRGYDAIRRLFLLEIIKVFWDGH